MTQKQPVIGVICGQQREIPARYVVNRAYIQAVLAAGGTPILIPYQPPQGISQIMDLLDGLLVPGGIDIDPHRYGQDPALHCGEIDPHKDELDLTMAELALQRDLPVLAICRGLQILNVALGGSLIQDIPSQVSNPIKHRQQAPGWHATHGITFQSSGLLKEIWGNAPARVNSFHHQSIDLLGANLQLAAAASDGVIEAVESTKHRFVLGVQWHPELMFKHCPAAARIFETFIAACSAN